ncbi:MAG: hypothetical protein GEEBNDBF_00639 [bacterium]|nr:hypothetical protein [bacterium]
MPRSTLAVHDWSDLQADYQGGSLLIGNGFSTNIWEPFSYASLLQRALDSRTSWGADALTAVAEKLFSDLSTNNFEEVMGLLEGAILVLAAQSKPLDQEQEILANVRTCLVKAVQEIHVSHSAVAGQLHGVSEEFRNYSWVFTTNYDLLPYWALMSRAGKNNSVAGFDDFFRNGEFSRYDYYRGTDWTKICYLHGALHLSQSGSRTSKLSREQFSDTFSADSILEVWAAKVGDGTHRPLYVAEGTAAKKESAVANSEYLLLMREAFRALGRPKETYLTVIGHSLGGSDRHLLDAMRGWDKPKIAVSVRLPPGDDASSRASLLQELQQADITFFSAETHPLLAPSLRVTGTPP